ncbi:hypothetical protein RYX36_009203, partial [Vicia faba]
MGVLSGLIAAGKWFDQICNWKNPITTDAYCVAKYGQKWVRTRTIIDSFSPRWNEQYTWEVFDPCTVITIERFKNQEDSAHPDELDEKLDTFPTTRPSDIVRMRYDRLRSIAGRIQTIVGDLATQDFHLLFSANHYIHPLTVSQLDSLRHQATQIVSMRLSRAEPPLRKEVVEYMLDVGSHMWSMRRSKANFFRIMGVLSGLIAAGKWFDQICNWKNPITTDAYCVAKYGQKWVRTRTIIDSFAPRWNEQYTWEVFDP